MLSFTDAADRVKGSLDIVDIVQRHVMLKKSGRNYTGLCPFHKDKNPSMSVSREKGFFKCFACGVGGDALTFLMKLENKTYGEVIKELAAEQGIDILYEGQNPEVAAQKKDLKQKIVDLNTKAREWFETQLAADNPDAQKTRQYLEGRKLDADIMGRFQLGYAPPGWNNLRDYLTSQSGDVRENPELLGTAGLVKPRMEGDGSYDAFRNRLIVPILDDKGQTVAFGGRALSDEDKPKYLNSPETPVYVKSRVLYGLWQAKESIAQTKSAVIMEGYFDVIRAHWGGVTQAVGSCGTALTDGHLKLLSRYGAETIYLAFDSDEAGLKAAISAIAIIEPYLETNPLTIRIVVTPSGKDPDDFIRDNGGDAFKALMQAAPGFLDFKFNMALRGIDFTTSESRVDAANRLTPLLAAIGKPVLRAEYLRKYAERIGVTEEALLLEVKRYEQAKKPSSGYYPVNFKKKSSKWGGNKAIPNRDRPFLGRNTAYAPSDNTAELRRPLIPDVIACERLLLNFLLYMALYNQDICHIMLGLLHKRTLTQPVHQEILDTLVRLTQQPEQFQGNLLPQLGAAFGERPDAQALIAELAMTADKAVEAFGLTDASRADWTHRITRELQRYDQLLSRHEREQALRQLKAETDDEVELQYQIMDRLLSRHRTQDTNQQ